MSGDRVRTAETKPGPTVPRGLWRAQPNDPLSGDPLWDLWQDLMRRYPLWRSMVAAFTPWSPFHRERSWFWFDVIRGLRSMPSSRNVVSRLDTVADGDLDGVITLAEVNSRRQEHFLRTLVLSYITVPFAVGAIWAQLAPGQLIGLLRDPEWVAVWAGGLAGLVSALLLRFLADWRARAFLALLLMARAERNAARLREASLTIEKAPLRPRRTGRPKA